MTALLLRIAGWIGHRREWLILLALSIVAGSLYVGMRTARADRDAWAHWGDQLCGFAGATTAPATVEVDTDKGRRKVDKARGQLCLEAVRDLASYRAQAQAGTARVLADAQAEQASKGAADRRAASAAAADRRGALSNMEESDAKIGDDDRVDGNWFAGLNRLGGLRSSD